MEQSPPGNKFEKRLSQKQKRANNYAWYEDHANRILNASNVTERNIRFKTNFDHYNGRGSLEDINDSVTLSAINEDGGGFKMVRHWDIISNIASSMVGDEEKRPFDPICVDLSPEASNERKNQLLLLVQQHIQQTIIDPKIKMVQEEIFNQLGENPNQEQIEEAKKMVNEKVESMTLSEIHNYMRKEYKGSSSITGQKLLTWILKDQGIKFLFKEGFKNLIITGLPVFYGTIINDQLHTEIVNPLGFDYGGLNNSFFIEDAEWWLYRQTMTMSEVYRRHSKDLTKKQLVQLDTYLQSYGNNKAQEDSNVIRVVENIGTDAVSHINVLSQDGQASLQQLYSRSNLHLTATTSGVEVDYYHIVWRALSKFKYITRSSPEGEEGVYRTEEYVFGSNPYDIKEEILWIPQLQETTIIKFGGETIYLNKRPLPDQYLSLDDPYTLKGPYYGFAWGSFYGNSNFLAPMDKAKANQYDYNVIRSKITKIIAEDKGKVLLMALQAIPSGYTIEQWMELLNDGVALVSTDRPSDAQIFKDINLADAQDLQNKIALLEMIKSEAAFNMSYNPSRLGQISPYMTVTNNQQNILQSVSQTEDIYYTFNTLKERFLTYLINLAKALRLRDKKALTYTLDDFSIAEIDVDPFTLAQSKYAVFVSNEADDINNMLSIKGLMQSMVQNQLISFPELIKSQYSKSGRELLNIAEQAELRRQQEIQNNQQAQMEANKQAQEAEMAKLQMQYDNAFRLKEMEMKYKLEMERINSMIYANQKDIDKDMQNDDLEIKQEELKVKKEEGEKDRILKLEIEKLKLKNKN